MKTLTCFLILTLTLIGENTLFAQPKSTKFGKVQDEVVKMTEYAPDLDADAVILYDKGSYRVDIVGEGMALVFERHMRIKILKPGGMPYADIEIPYFGYNNIDKINGVSAITHYLDESGEVQTQKVDRKSMFDEDLDGYFFIKKFSFPQAKEGAVLEYKYRIDSKDWTSVSNWYFQKEIPVAYSELQTQFLDGFNYRALMLGEVQDIERETASINQPIRSSRIAANRTNYIAKDIPAFQEEPYSNSLEAYYFRIEHQLSSITMPGIMNQNYLKSWAQYNANLVESEGFGKAMIPNKKVKELAAKAQEVEASERLSLLFQIAQKSFRWSGSHGMYPNKKPGELLREQEGNAASINSFLIALLNAAGYEAFPVLISIRDRGLVQTVFPTLRQFNHMIVFVQDGEHGLLMDASDTSVPFNMLPRKDLNGAGLVIKNGGPKWVSLAPSHKIANQTNGFFNIQKDGTIEGKFSILCSGYDGLSERSKLSAADSEEAYMEEQVMEDLTEAELGEFTLENQKDHSKPLMVSYQLSCSDFCNATGDFIYLNPLMNHAVEENPFTQEKRNHPVDFAAPMDQKYVFSFNLPEGYEVESLPKATKVTLPDGAGTFTYQTSSSGPMLQLMTSWSINKAVFPPEEYEYLKQFFDLITAKHAEQVVLKRKMTK